MTKQQSNFKKAVALAKQLQKKQPSLKYTDAIKKAFAQMKSGKVGASKKSSSTQHKDTKSHNVNIRVVSGVKQRKTKDEFVIQGNYGHGWEDLSSYDNRREAVSDLKAYRENDKYGYHRLITRRVKIGAVKIIQKGEDKNAKVTKTLMQLRTKKGTFKGYKRVSGIGFSLNKRGQLI